MFLYKRFWSKNYGGDEMTNLNGLRDRRVVALVEKLEAVDSLYGITPEERNVLDVLHGVSDFANEFEE